jgi:hypothetical protein
MLYTDQRGERTEPEDSVQPGADSDALTGLLHRTDLRLSELNTTRGKAKHNSANTRSFSTKTISFDNKHGSCVEGIVV